MGKTAEPKASAKKTIKARQKHVAAPRAGKSEEEYLTAAFELNGDEFLKYFQDSDDRVFQNYKALCSENGSLEEFTASPLVFILANQPRCCTAIAKNFVDTKQPTEEGR